MGLIQDRITKINYQVEKEFNAPSHTDDDLCFATIWIMTGVFEVNPSINVNLLPTTFLGVACDWSGATGSVKNLNVSKGIAAYSHDCATPFILTGSIADNAALNLAKASLQIVYALGDSASSVTQNLTLPSTVNGVNINWSSGNTNVIGNDGTVNRQVGLYDTLISLVANLSKNAAVGSASFSLTVKKLLSAFKTASYSANTTNATSFSTVIGSGYPASNIQFAVTYGSNTIIFISNIGQVSSFDGTNWKYYDGTGTGTGPYCGASQLIFSSGTGVLTAVGAQVIGNTLYVVSAYGMTSCNLSTNVWTACSGVLDWHTGSQPLGSNYTATFVGQYNGCLFISNNTGGIASFDGANWKNADGTGTGTGVYRVSTNGNDSISSSCAYKTYLVVGSTTGGVASYDGANWKNADGTGTGTGPYSNNALIGQSFWCSAMVAYKTNLVIGNYYGKISSFDGTNWKYPDGTGTGTGPYSSNAGVGFPISSFAVNGNMLYVTPFYQGLSSFDGTNWKYWDGTGTGTGPYEALNSDLLNGICVYYKNQVVVTSAFGTICSFDGTNWKYPDGTGTGTGLYGFRKVGTSAFDSCISAVVYNGKLVVGSTSGCVSSFDLSSKTWTPYNNGSGICNAGTALGMCVNNAYPTLSTMCVYNGMLIVGGTNGRIASFDGTNWKNYDGTGTGTGPYNDGTALGAIATIGCAVNGMISFQNMLVISGTGNTGNGFKRTMACYNSAGWKNHDGTGAGTGTIFTHAVPNDSGSGVYFLAQLTIYNNVLYFINQAGLNSHDGTNFKWNDGTGTGTGTYKTSGANYISVYKSCLVVTNNNNSGTQITLSSFDGTNWKNYDGTGTGTGPYSTVPATSGVIQICTVGNFLVVNGGAGLSSYDGTNWKYSNSYGTVSGTGTGPATYSLVNDVPIFLYQSFYVSSIVPSTDGSGFYMLGKNSTIGSWDAATKSFTNFTNSNILPLSAISSDGYHFTTGSGNGYDLKASIVYNGSILFGSGAGRISSFDGTNWKYWDGTGTGTGFYCNIPKLGIISSMIVYGGKLVISGYNNTPGSPSCIISSYDGTNWKYYDGTGTGTGPYLNYSVSDSNTFGFNSLVLYKTYLIASIKYLGYVSSFDGTNWKNYDGTGTGTGPYHNFAATIFDVITFGNYLVVSGPVISNQEMISSYDGANWKNADGTGTGTGPYNAGTAIGSTTSYNYCNMTVYNGYLIVSGTNGNIASWEPINGWKNYNGTGTGTGIYLTSPVNAYWVIIVAYKNYLIEYLNGGYGIVSYDGSNWASYNGGGTGSTGPFGVPMTSTFYAYSIAQFNGVLYLTGGMGELVTYDGTARSSGNNTQLTGWKDYFGNGTGTGPYGFGINGAVTGETLQCAFLYNNSIVFLASAGYPSYPYPVTSALSSYNLTTGTWTSYDAGSGLCGNGFLKNTGISTTWQEAVNSYCVLGSTIIISYYSADGYAAIVSFDGTNWKNSDGTGTGTGPYYMSKYNTSLNAGQPNMSSPYCIESYNGYLIVATNSGYINSWEPINGWKWWDGTGTGTGIYGTNTFLQTSGGVVYIKKYSTYLLVANYNGLSSFDGTNWKYCDGTGTGNGPYSTFFNSNGSNQILDTITYKGNLIVANYNGVSSFDGTNWKYHNGTGTGNGPYFGVAGTSMGNSGLIRLAVIKNQLVFFTSGDVCCSYDGANWKYFDGSGIGTGIYSNNTLPYLNAIGTYSQDPFAVTNDLDGNLIFCGSNSKIYRLMYLN
jgi:hypothetical protein